MVISKQMAGEPKKLDRINDIINGSRFISFYDLIICIKDNDFYLPLLLNPKPQKNSKIRAL